MKSEEIREFKQKIKELEEHIKHLQKHEGLLKKQLENLTFALHQKERECKRLEDNCESMRGEIEVLLVQAKASKPEIEEKELLVTQKEQLIQELQKKLDKQEETIMELKQRNNTINTELKVAKAGLNQEYIRVQKKNAKILLRQKREIEEKDRVIKELAQRRVNSRVQIEDESLEKPRDIKLKTPIYKLKASQHKEPSNNVSELNPLLKRPLPSGQQDKYFQQFESYSKTIRRNNTLGSNKVKGAILLDRRSPLGATPLSKISGDTMKHKIKRNNTIKCKRTSDCIEEYDFDVASVIEDTLKRGARNCEARMESVTAQGTSPSISRKYKNTQRCFFS
eukprot:TRINITY_DN6951_c0_g2_i1.p1 TRINITY_DN6951_c0_g2~~TRINITY_DN6951_c0_g2_i1.p1  ORF type:complete len:337 (+),score=73.64 TRINITY_DN6951_c0_g2_i1:467-1477(+)